MSDNVEPTDENPTPGVARFVAYQEPNPVLAEHIRNIEQITATQAPAPVAPPVDPDREEFDAWKRGKAAVEMQQWHDDNPEPPATDADDTVTVDVDH